MARKKKEIKGTTKNSKLLKEIREIIRKNPKLKKKRLHNIKDIERRLYYCKVWSITERQPLHTLPNSKKRCLKGPSCFHLDHKCSIYVGWLKKIPPEVIGHIDNLRFIPADKNMEKGYKVTKYRLQETMKKVRNKKGRK